VFSLGAMLYEMIAGARPFTSGNALGVLHEIAYGAIVPVRARRPEATADLERIVLRALERDVTRRYQSMEEFSSHLRHAHRDILADAPTAMETPAPTVVAPTAPLVVPPPLPTHAAQPPASQSGSTYAPLPAPSGSSTPFTAKPDPRALRRARRSGRRVRKGRPLWRKVAIVVSILFLVNWVRTRMFDTPRVERGRPDAGDAQPSPPNDLGQTIEDAVASGLSRIGSGSAEIQLASAKIYWKRAQQTKDPVSIKKAEDAFNEAIRLGLKDTTDQSEARDALRQIAALKTPAQDAPTIDESSGRPANDSPPDPR
jgi:hypothetical protein